MPVLIAGLLVFGVFFAVNSSLHSFLIVAYAGNKKAAEDIGFYYAANAAGRLAGTFLSGFLVDCWRVLLVRRSFLLSQLSWLHGFLS